MKIRYQISDAWQPSEIIQLVEAASWGISTLGIVCPKSKLNIKLLTGANETTLGTTERLKSKRYEIRVIYHKDFLRTFFHELMHVKQYHLEKLNMDKKSWKGVTYENFSYLESPWEVEARGMEDYLLHEFLEVY